jgi:hypothetical protein
VHGVICGECWGNWIDRQHRNAREEYERGKADGAADRDAMRAEVERLKTMLSDPNAPWDRNGNRPASPCYCRAAGCGSGCEVDAMQSELVRRGIETERHRHRLDTIVTELLGPYSAASLDELLDHLEQEGQRQRLETDREERRLRGALGEAADDLDRAAALCGLLDAQADQEALTKQAGNARTALASTDQGAEPAPAEPDESGCTRACACQRCYDQWSDR